MNESLIMTLIRHFGQVLELEKFSGKKTDYLSKVLYILNIIILK
jgi:hypothetical protein